MKRKSRRRVLLSMIISAMLFGGAVVPQAVFAEETMKQDEAKTNEQQVIDAESGLEIDQAEIEKTATLQVEELAVLSTSGDEVVEERTSLLARGPGPGVLTPEEEERRQVYSDFTYADMQVFGWILPELQSLSDRPIYVPSDFEERIMLFEVQARIIRGNYVTYPLEDMKLVVAEGMEIYNHYGVLWRIGNWFKFNELDNEDYYTPESLAIHAALREEVKQWVLDSTITYQQLNEMTKDLPEAMDYLVYRDDVILSQPGSNKEETEENGDTTSDAPTTDNAKPLVNNNTTSGTPVNNKKVADSVQTGDTALIGVYITLFVFFGVVLTILILHRRNTIYKGLFSKR
jgi:hypothetical protein